MIQLSKETKVKLLKAIQTGIFDGEQFPELAGEIKTIQIEVINSRDQVKKDNYESIDIEGSEN